MKKKKFIPGVPHVIRVGSEIKKLGTLTEEDLHFLKKQSHPGLKCSFENVSVWVMRNEDIRK